MKRDPSRQLPRVERRMAAHAQVIGVGFGWKETGGEITDTPAWRVYVRRKLPLEALAPCDVIPASCDGLPTDVVAVDQALPAAHWLACDPAAPGALLSNLRSPCNGAARALGSGLGTLGFFARPNRVRAPALVLVSNRHVLLAHGARAGDPVYRPALVTRDGVGAVRADPTEPIGEIVDDGFEGNFAFHYPGEPEREFFVDCATARVASEQRVSADAAGALRGVARMHPLDALGSRAPRVRKLGGASGVTLGRVVDVAAPIEFASGPRRLNNLVIRGEHGPFVAPGDSGALVIDARDRAIGMVWGRGERDPTVAYASHIHAVLARLDVTLMTRGVS